MEEPDSQAPQIADTDITDESVHVTVITPEPEPEPDSASQESVIPTLETITALIRDLIAPLAADVAAIKADMSEVVEIVEEAEEQETEEDATSPETDSIADIEVSGEPAGESGEPQDAAPSEDERPAESHWFFRKRG